MSGVDATVARARRSRIPGPRERMAWKAVCASSAFVLCVDFGVPWLVRWAAAAPEREEQAAVARARAAASALPAVPTMSLLVAVRDPGGAPVVGATVHVRLRAAGGWEGEEGPAAGAAGEGGLLGLGRTDGTGSARIDSIPDTPVTLTVRAPGRATVCVPPVEDEALTASAARVAWAAPAAGGAAVPEGAPVGVTVILPAAHAVGGRVRDAEGRSVAAIGGAVAARPAGPGASPLFPGHQVPCDARGDYALGGLQEGTWRLEFVRRDGVRFLGPTVRVPGEDTADFTAGGAGRLDVRVRDPVRATPIAGAIVAVALRPLQGDITEIRARSHTGSDGTASFRHLPAARVTSVEVTLRERTFRVANPSAVVVPGLRAEVVVRTDRPLPVAAVGPATAAGAFLGGTVLRGTVRWQAGSGPTVPGAIPEVVVRSVLPPGPASTMVNPPPVRALVQPDPSGFSYSVVVGGPGPWMVAARAPGSAGAFAGVSARPGGPLPPAPDLVLVPERCISGILRDGDGAPREGVVVRAAPAPEPFLATPPADSLFDLFPGAPVVAITDGNGVFRLGGLSSVPHFVSIAAHGRDVLRVRAHPDDGPLSLVLPPPALLRGTVLDGGSGRVVPGAHVTVEGDGSGDLPPFSVEGLTPWDGKFEIPLPRGQRVRVRVALLPGTPPVIPPVPLLAPRTLEGVDPQVELKVTLGR